MKNAVFLPAGIVLDNSLAGILRYHQQEQLAGNFDTLTFAIAKKITTVARLFNVPLDGASILALQMVILSIMSRPAMIWFDGGSAAPYKA